MRERVLKLCLGLPSAEASHPFGEDTAVLKIGGRMFALVDLAGEHGRVTVKADPGYAAALVERHQAVTPGYYMNKRHWVTIDMADTSGGACPVELVEELVEDSYDLVVAGLPARLRPVPRVVS